MFESSRNLKINKSQSINSVLIKYSFPPNTFLLPAEVGWIDVLVMVLRMPDNANHALVLKMNVFHFSLGEVTDIFHMFTKSCFGYVAWQHCISLLPAAINKEVRA